ncbi:MAG: glutamate synthase subunit beta [Candidatus Omnitrophota bacterium]
MGDIKGFLKIKRQKSAYRPVCERVHDFDEVALIRPEIHSKEQASRCMDCGIPFCHWGCPVGNYIPEWNDLIHRGQWKKAYEMLQATNNLPEITGRICPALCEFSCVLGINDDPVTIRENELAVVEYAFAHGFVKPQPPQKRTGKKVAVIGSGPAGLACADQLNKAGHRVVVFEKDDAIGGILTYGIPDFKLDKKIMSRRVSVLKKEGVVFKTSVDLIDKACVADIKKEFDAVSLTMGSRTPRDLAIEGRNLTGIHFAMDYLVQSNKRVAGGDIPQEKTIDARGKKVVVIGGGDTGADCVGVAHRQKAACVVQIELFPMPPDCRTASMPWPKYPLLLKTSTSHEEGGQRDWAVSTKKFTGEKGAVKKLSCVRVTHGKDTQGCPVIQEIKGSEFEIEADLVILALGFLHVEYNPLLEALGVSFDQRGNILADQQFKTAAKGVFAAGDARRGQSLIVWAIAEGRRAAYHIDTYLMGRSNLPVL